jgi:prophage regulatory protein
VHATDQLPSRRIERLPAVLARIGCSRSKLYDLVAHGEFSPPLKIGRISGWDSRAVDAWIEAHSADAAKPRGS